LRTSGVIFEHNTCDVDRVRIKFGTRRDRVKPRLETRDRRNNDVEGNLPCSGVRGSRCRSDIITGGELEEFAKFEAALCNGDMVFFLVCVEVPEVSLGRGSGTKFSQDTENLPACDGADVNVVPEYSGVCCRHREWHFGKSWVERLDSNDGIPLLRKAKGTKKALHLEVRVRRPNAHVVTMLVRYTGPLNVEFHMNTISGMGILEQLAGHGNGSSIWVLRIVNALRPGEGACRQLAWIKNVNKRCSVVGTKDNIPR
jgi:hypothetical protein